MRLCRSTKLLLILGLIALLAMPAAAQEPSWRSFSTADGLPASRAWVLAQDAEGTLWVGTDHGLSKFFDRSFHSEAAMPDTVAGARISALLATPDGSLWVGSNAGLFRRNPDGSWADNLEREAGLDTTEISALLLDHEGAVWVGAWNGLVHWDGNSWEQSTVGGIAPQVIALAQDAEDRLWVVETIQLQILHNGELVKTIREDDGLPPGAALKEILRDRQGDMWLATAGGLVQLVDLSVHRIFTESDGLGSRAVWSLAEDYQNGLWVGTEFGLVHLADGIVDEFLTSADGLADDRVYSLFHDREGNLWVATDGGLTRLPLGQWRVESAPQLKRVPISALLPDQADGDYVAIPDGLAYRPPDGQWSILSDGFPGRTTYALIRDRSGQLWAGTDGGLVRWVDGRFVPDERLPITHTVTALLADSRGALWVGTHQGLHRLADGTQTLYSKTGGELGQDSVLSLWETRMGDVWVGTLGGGASRFHQGEWQHVGIQSTAGGLSSDIVLTGLEDSAGNLWFGTSWGLSRLQAGANPADRSAWRSFVEPAVASNRINVLWEDKLRPGHIWAGTESGLNLIVGDHPSTFTRQDGLSHKRITALGQEPDGTLWIGTALGLTYHQDALQAPQIKLDELLVNQRVCDTECLAKGLPYSSHTALFQYRGSDLGNLEGLRYRYSIQRSTDKVELDTSDDLTSTTALLVDLTPGATYTLAVAAVDKDFNESPATEPLVLRVKAATAWDRARDHKLFPLMVVGALVLMLFGGNAGGRWYRTRGKHHYFDVHITVAPTERPERALAQLEAHRIRRVSRFRLVNRLIRILPMGSQSRRPTVSVHDIPIDLADIKEIQESIRRLEDDQVDEFRLRSIGGRLYQMLLAQKPIAEQLEHLGLGWQKLRLRLSFDGHATLSNQPWELLYGGDNIGFLGQRADTALVRFVDPVDNFERPVVDKKLRVLVIMAQPNDERVRELNLVAEKTHLDKVLAGIAEVEYLFGMHAAKVLGAKAEAKDLPDQLLEHLKKGWDVVHFVGHAGLDLEPAGEPKVVLWCEDRRGDYLALSAKELEQSLTAAEQIPKLVVLNACETASLESELVRTILNGGVGAVVGMQWPVLDKAAESFTEGFYSTLRYHGQVDHAISVARNQMARRTGEGRRDWAAPVLVMQTVDGLIFERA